MPLNISTLTGLILASSNLSSNEDDILPSVEGEWFFPNSNHCEKTVLNLEKGYLVVSNDVGQIFARAPVGKIAISQRLAGIARELTFPDQSLFTSFDNDGIDRLLEKTKHHSSIFIADLEQFRPRLFVFILIAIMCIYGLYKGSIPIFVDIAVYATPNQFPQALGKSVLETLNRTILSSSTIPQQRQNEVSAIFARLTQAADKNPNRFHLYFRKAPEKIGPNAFAMPDGSVVITDALITFAGNDDAMIAGVLAHEIGHVENKHSLRQIYRAAGISTLIMFVTGDMGEFLENIISQGSVLLSLSYSRASEAEADRFGVILTANTGYDPQGLIRFFEKLDKDYHAKKEGENEPSIFDTHPADEERIAAILAEIKQLELSSTRP